MIDYEKAKQLLQQAVAERGEGFSYHAAYGNDDSCVYATATVDDQNETVYEPACLIGYGLSLYDHELLPDLYYAASEVFLDILDVIEVEFDPYAVELFRIAQERQDLGDPWGYSVRYAISEVEQMRKENGIAS